MLCEKFPLRLIWKLQLVQNAVAILLTGALGCVHTMLVLKELDWLLISYQATFKDLLLTNKPLNNLKLDYLMFCLLNHTYHMSKVYSLHLTLQNITGC